MDPGRLGCLGLALATLVVFAVVAVSVWNDRPSAEPAARSPVSAPLISVPSPSAAAERLVVSVVGRVNRPGLVTVGAGARVADALREAGGPLPDTDITALNLARKLVDGEQLYVAVPVPPESAGAANPVAPQEGSGDAGKLDLNTATKEQLDALPGVGRVTAERIVQWRTERGRFTSVDQLREVGGIGAARFSRLRDLVRV